MPILPTTSGISYGIPMALTWDVSEFVDPDIPKVPFVRIISILTIDIRSLLGLILLGFLAIYAQVGGQLIGPLHHPGNDDGGNGSVE